MAFPVTPTVKICVLLTLLATPSYLQDNYDPTQIESVTPHQSNVSSTSTFWQNAPRILRSVRSFLGSCWPPPPKTGAPESTRNSAFIGKFVQHCMGRKSLRALDRLIQKPVIDITSSIKLVKVDPANTENANFSDSSGGKRVGKLDDKTADWSVDDDDDVDGADSQQSWRSQVVDRIVKLLHSHRLQVQMKPIVDITAEARRRHHLTPMLVFGAMASAIIAIPMMFQFLSVLGGKALLLAKLALILTAIQGLKKIATSNVNYGLYSSPGFQSPWDRKWYLDMNLDYRPPFGAGPLAQQNHHHQQHQHQPHLHHDDLFDQFSNVPERSYVPDMHQMMRPRSTVVTEYENDNAAYIIN